MLSGLLASGISQADVSGVIERCGSLDDKDSRIVCLEDALRRTEHPDDAAPSVAEMTPPAALESGSVPQQVQAQAEQEVVASPPPAQESAVSSGHAGAADTLGAEQVADHDRRDDEEDRVTATVVAFDFVRYQRLRVQLDNGQVWRQVDGDRANVSRDLDAGSRFDVELWKTGLGGYRMRIVPVDRTIRVQRLK